MVLTTSYPLAPQKHEGAAEAAPSVSCCTLRYCPGEAATTAGTRIGSCVRLSISDA